MGHAFGCQLFKFPEPIHPPLHTLHCSNLKNKISQFWPDFFGKIYKKKGNVSGLPAVAKMDCTTIPSAAALARAYISRLSPSSKLHDCTAPIHSDFSVRRKFGVQRRPDLRSRMSRYRYNNNNKNEQELFFECVHNNTHQKLLANGICWFVYISDCALRCVFQRPDNVWVYYYYSLYCTID